LSRTWTFLLATLRFSGQQDERIMVQKDTVLAQIDNLQGFFALKRILGVVGGRTLATATSKACFMTVVFGKL
jgi:hypothetical protein